MWYNWGLRRKDRLQVVTRTELQRTQDLHHQGLTMELLCTKNIPETCWASTTLQDATGSPPWKWMLVKKQGLLHAHQ